MATLYDRYTAREDGNNQNFLVTASFVPATNDILLVKIVCGDDPLTVTGVTGGGWTYNLIANNGPASNCRVVFYWARVTAGGSSQTVRVDFGGSGNAVHSIEVERWGFADIAATPAYVAAHGTGVPSASLTTTADSSMVSWAAGDWVATDGTGRVYDESTDPAHEQSYVFVSGQYTAYYATSDAASARSHNIGLTAPTGQTWCLVGVEVLDAGGAAQLDPLPQTLQTHPPGRFAPNGAWSPLVGRPDDPPTSPLRVAPTYPANVVLAGGIGIRSFPAVVTQPGDYVVVEVVTEDVDNLRNVVPSCTGLSFGQVTDAAVSSHTVAQQYVALDYTGGSRTVLMSPAGGINQNTSQYRGNLTVVRRSAGPGATAVNGAGQTVSFARLGNNSGVLMAVGDWTAGPLNPPQTWTPGGATIASQQQSPSATYIFGRWDDSGAVGTAAHGISSPAYGSPTIAALEMLGIPAAPLIIAPVWPPTVISPYSGIF